MNLWPFGGRETRSESDSYTDAIVQAILQRAGAQAVETGATAALEAVSGLCGRAFASADVTARPGVLQALTPAMLAMIGRALIRRGEFLALIDTRSGRLDLAPAYTATVAGGPNPETWSYELTLGGPGDSETYKNLPADAVVHIRYAVDPERPWRGVGPIQAAAIAGRLSAEVSTALANEASGPVANLIPTPTDGDDPTVEELRTDLRTAKGEAMLLEGGDWGGAPSGGVASWKPNRLGANPPASLVELAALASEEVYAACGVNPAVFKASQGTAGREAYRQVLHGLIAPVGKLAAAELTDKLAGPVTLDWSELRAGDIAGRARAFQSMVGAGMDASKAAALAGLMVDDAA